MRTSFALATAAALLLFAIPAATVSAASATWTGGGGDSDWANTSNWSASPVPGAGDVATFDGTSAADLTNVPSSLGGLTIDNGTTVSLASLAAGNEMTIADGGVFIGSASDSLTVAASITVNVTNPSNGSPQIEVVGTLAIGGRLNVGTLGNQPVAIFADATTGSLTLGSLGVNECRLQTNGVAGTEATITINGGITYLGNGAQLDGDPGLQAGENFVRLVLGGNFDLGSNTGCFAFLDFITIELNGNVTMTGGASSVGDEISIGKLIVGVGETFTFDPALAGQNNLSLFEIDNEGTIDLGTQDPVYFRGSRRTGIAGVFRNASGATFTATGPISTQDSLLRNDTLQLDGTWVFAGTFTNNLVKVVATFGSTVTFNGDVTVNDAGGGWVASIGAQEDGATDSGYATLSFNARASFLTAAALQIGEGIYNFGGDIDLGGSTSTSGVVNPPTNPANNFDVQVHFTGTTMAVSSSTAGTGSLLQLDSVAAGTRVTHTGNLVVVTAFNTSGATGATPFTVWSTADSLVFGSRSFGNEIDMVLGDGDVVSTSTVQVEEVNNGSASQFTQLNITRTAGTVGRLRFRDFTANGDTLNDVAGPETNASRVNADGVHFVIGDGAQGYLRAQTGAPPNEGNGAFVSLVNCTIEINALADLSAAGGGTDDTYTSTIWMEDCTITFGTNSQVSIGEGATFVAIDTSFSGSGAWAFNATAASAQTTLVNGSVSGGSPGDLNLTFYSALLQLYGVAFSNYDATGIEIGGEVFGLTNCTFSGGVTDGAHITCTNIYAGSDRFFDNNTFDNSVNVVIGQGLNNGELVHGSGPFIFRTTGDDFGIGAFNITAAEAEADGDEDGTTVDTHIRWLNATSSVAAAESTNSQAVTVGITDGNEYTTLDFTLTPSGASPTLTTLAVLIQCDGQLDTATDILAVNLYYDQDANGSFTALEQLGTQAPGGDTVTFTGLSVALADGVAGRFAVRITFQGASAGQAGHIRTVILPNFVALSGSPMVSGLPVATLASTFTGPAVSLDFVSEPFGPNSDPALDTQPVIELRDTNGQRVVADSSTSLTASVNTGPGTLTGTVTVTASSGLVTFTDLGVSTAGSYKLTFDDGVVTLTIDSNSFTVSSVSGGGGGGGGDSGGGCMASGNGSNHVPLLALLLITLVVIRRWRC